MGDHQNLARAILDRHARDEAISGELRREDRPFLERCLVQGRGILHRAYRAPRSRARNLICSLASSRNIPVNCVVVVETPSLRTPRMEMHICSASTRTATPRVSSAASTAWAIWAVIASWVGRRRAK